MPMVTLTYWTRPLIGFTLFEDERVSSTVRIWGRSVTIWHT